MYGGVACLGVATGPLLTDSIQNHRYHPDRKAAHMLFDEYLSKIPNILAGRRREWTIRRKVSVACGSRVESRDQSGQAMRRSSHGRPFRPRPWRVPALGPRLRIAHIPDIQHDIPRLAVTREGDPS